MALIVQWMSEIQLDNVKVWPGGASPSPFQTKGLFKGDINLRALQDLSEVLRLGITRTERSKGISLFTVCLG